MRIWLRPDRLAKLGLTPSDVMSAIKEQNLQAPAGRIGMRPSPADQEFTYTVSAPGRLITEEEFANIIVRETATGGTVRIKDVGRVGARLAGLQRLRAPERQAGRGDGDLPAARRQPARGREGDLRDDGDGEGALPLRLDYKIVYDTTPAVEASIESIFHTFIEAIILVTLVVSASSCRTCGRRSSRS